MRAIMIFLTTFLLMYVDFAFAGFSPIIVSDVEVYFVPRVLLMFILLLSIYTGSRMSILLAVVFGAMLDFYIGSVYGIHAFGMVAFVLFMHTAFRVFHKDFVAMAFVVLLLTMLYDIYIYLLHIILDLVDKPVFDYMALRAAPSLLLNALLFTVVYVIALKTSRVRKEVLPKH
ncbi:rod shape-determining protein MreD [Salinicoccus sp. ID82-1]|uniref:rod shape-determining protein MreD n=1 Tax=Salinicoccus sp. ID82-1 TaxID=2820269 RepID=UPI001F027BF7|nr:rod shape-determining protein MreD [Salinicoccus sp. ID82-1]MCG1008852.1 rod shape-determining protein MreD [Salinicoccus sp. ID82-1]